ncbi:endonuclease/exonuclease/phosphatase family protein [Tropicimonas sediminicola]|nr:endonuclease/exonuclease/phosphatase family protein [Tropicimonas sediminicola]
MLLAVLGLSFAGEWLPLGDSLAVFRTHIAALTCGIAGIFVLSGGLRTSAVLAVFAFGSTAPLIVSSSTYGALGPDTYTLYQKNLLNFGRTPQAIADDIKAFEPDFVTLQELSTHNLHALESTLAQFPNRVICRSSEIRGVAMLTSHEIVEGTARCYPQLDLALAQVELGNKRIWVASVHLLWPFPYGQHKQARAIAAVISQLEGDIVVSGDFNMVRGGASVGRIERAANARAAGENLTTYPRFSAFAPLAIDHVLVPANSSAIVERRPLLGSDHYGLLAQFDI